MLPSNGSLDVEGFKIIAEMGVDVFVIVTFRKLAELPAEAFSACVVLAAGAPAVATPVTEALNQHLQPHVADHIDRTALAEREMMRRVEGLGGEIAEGSGEIRDRLTPVGEGFAKSDAVLVLRRRRVSRTQCIAIVFNEPQVVRTAESRDALKVEGIAKSVRHHHGFCLSRNECGVELIESCVESDWIGVEKNGNGTVLHNRGDGGWKSGGAGDDFVARPDAAIAELVTGQGGEGEQVGGRA